MTMRVVAGLFVGGASRRMSGRPKGLIRAPGGRTIIERMLDLLSACRIDDVVLVGAAGEYVVLGLPAIDDAPSGIGPLGGLVSLLRLATHGYALALACDMPFVSAALVQSLLDAPPAPVVAPRVNGLWEPLCARYEAVRVLPLAELRVLRRDHALQGLLATAGAVELPLANERRRELRDWDTPEDVIVDSIDR